MTEHDRSHRERTLTGDSMTSDRGRPRSFTEADKNSEKTNLKKTIGTAHGSSQTAPEDTAAAAAATDKKVVLVGKCRRNTESYIQRTCAFRKRDKN